MGVGAAPAEEPPVLRGRREVCAGQDPANRNHGRASDPILLAVAPDELALASGDLLHGVVGGFAARGWLDDADGLDDSRGFLRFRI
jgi:hypothetical protein